jgi:hypothetical protein
MYADKHRISLVGGDGDQAIAAMHDGHEHRLFCADATWCDYALFFGAAEIRVFMDGREGYPQQIIDDTRALVHTETGWRKKLDAWNITDVITPGTRLASLLSLLPNWKCLSPSEKVWACERKL